MPKRIAAFDNDGTLWSEQPYYNQVAFAARPHQGPAPPSIPSGGKGSRSAPCSKGTSRPSLAGTPRDRLELLAASHAGMTTEEFERIVAEWMATARHPRFNRPYTELVYQPMLELLAYLRANGFKTYIVSGGGVEFMRPWAEQVYGIPPEQVIGSTIKMKYEIRDGRPVLVRLPEIDFIDDGAGKPVGIHRFIGRRPIAGLRQLRRRLRDAPLDDRRPRTAARPDRPPHRRGPRMGLRPSVARRPPGQGARRGPQVRLGRGGHEGGLEEGLRNSRTERLIRKPR